MSYFAVLLLMLAMLPGSSHAADLAIESIRFFDIAISDGYDYIGEKKVAVKKGDRTEFHEYNLHEGMAPNLMEVRLVVSNHAEEAVQHVRVRMALSLKVGNIVLHQGVRDLPDHAATQQSAEWFAPILLLSQSVPRILGYGQEEVTFGPINLAEILSSYDQRGLWPVMLKVEASVEPVKPEEKLGNNIARREMNIHMVE